MTDESQAKIFNCRVIGLEWATHDVRVVRLETARRGVFAFKAGQYAKLAFKNQPARDYSMANRPDRDILEFHVRQMSGEGVSTYVANGLKLDEKVKVQGPFGEACLRDEHDGPILAIAGGSGLAPIKSIVETALVRDPRRQIHLYFGVRERKDLYLDKHFHALADADTGLRFCPVLSHESSSGRHRCGDCCEIVAADHGSLAGFKAYLAGPPAMIEAAIARLLDLGLPEADIHADPFYGDAEQVQRLATRRGPIWKRGR